MTARKGDRLEARICRRRLFGGENGSHYVKDGINDCVVQGNQGAVNPEKQGTKVAAHYRVTIGAGQTQVIRLRLSKTSPDQKRKPFGKHFDEVFTDRLREADEFYKSVTPPTVSEDAAKMRVSRALERLRAQTAGLGSACSASVLGTLLLERAVEAAPGSLAPLLAGIKVENMDQQHAARGYGADSARVDSQITFLNRCDSSRADSMTYS